MRSRGTATLGAGLLLALCLGVLPLAGQAQDFQPTERQVLDRIVAVVNEGAIMESELAERVAQTRSQLAGRGTELPPERVLREQVLDRMIIEEIQLQMARNAGLSVDDTELNRQVRAIAESNGMTLEQFADALEADGLTLASVRKEVRREMLLRQLQQRQVASRVNVSDREVERFLEQQGGGSGQGVIEEHRARHILIDLTPERDDDQARRLAEQLRDRLEAGESFAALAQEYSGDRGSAMNGGELGWVRPGQTVPAFEEALEDLEIGEISAPVRSQFGYHLIQVGERRRQDVSGEARRDQIRQALFQRKANEELEVWLQEIRSQAFVDNRLADR
ncbi:peptidylprolyl isomerase [Halomonas sp. LBP4]|uniref:peptidylprolyl isomerase n=1 Tax=Halomonas sp. LBP4 TaxID=2044917 RepID=UPI000D75CB99|nr:peptidylprolyl isomerase [Halomonas sp. LBP4]PXX98529.1 peptidylprolyl isomerase [Halomonas sp. LBP4]